MLNLKNLYTGKKLIKDILTKDQQSKQPWSKKSLEKFNNKNLRKK